MQLFSGEIGDAGPVLDAVTLEARELAAWLPQLAALKPPDARPQAWASLNVFKAALPALIYCVNVTNRSVGLKCLADPATDDADLVAEALTEVERIVTFGLLLIKDTPGLRTRKDWPATKQALDHFQILGTAIRAVGQKVFERFGERLQELGLVD
ncbi:MAG: hypothetical protein ACRDYZ_05905 [Acidimicrobiales bacterium]